jgi:hypothetical protein
MQDFGFPVRTGQAALMVVHTLSNSANRMSVSERAEGLGQSTTERGIHRTPRIVIV